MNGSGKKIPESVRSKTGESKEFEQVQTVPICWKCDEIDPVCAHMRVKNVGNHCEGSVDEVDEDLARI